MSFSSSYRTDVQGLRAIAVISVVVFHAWPSLLPGGFIGVDIFFVISGFLIGGIIFRDLEAGQFSLADFYRKRIRRIFPALFVVLFFTLVAGAFIMGPPSYRDLARNTLSTILFLSNLDFYLHSGYFGREAETIPLLHTWSLSVEEQFYVIFPLYLMLLIRICRRRLVVATLMAVIVLAALSEWALSRSPMAAYFLSPFRGFELLLGALAAYARPITKASEVVRWSGLALILASIILIDAGKPFPGLWALPPTLGTALILWAGIDKNKQSKVVYLLSVTPLLFIGSISYSLYLWHWPLMAYIRILLPPEQSENVMGLVVLASLVAGWLSWRYVETRFASAPVDRSPILRTGVLGMAIFLLAGLLVWSTGGAPGRFSAQTLSFFQAAEMYSPNRANCHQQDPRRKAYDETCVLGEGVGHTTSVVVWGDSHGTELSAVLADNYVVRQITASACPPVIKFDFPTRPNCRSINEEMLQALVSDTEVKTVVLAINREAYLELDSDGFESGFRTVVDRLSAAGKKIIMIGQIPNPNLDAPQVAGFLNNLSLDTSRVGRELKDIRQENKEWRLVQDDLARLPNVDLIDPASDLCENDFCPIVRNGQVLYFNSSHVSMYGAELIATSLRNSQILSDK